MASIKIKSNTSSSCPSSLGARELGIWQNNLYFGGSNNKPIRLLTENDQTGGGAVYPLYVTDGEYTELNILNNTNYYIDGTSFYDIYIYPSMNDSPVSVSIAVHAIDENGYNIIPVDANGSQSQDQQKINIDWGNFSGAATDDWIIYTCTPKETSSGWCFLWDRKHYVAYQ